MNLSKALTCIAVCVVIGGNVGLGIGWLLGRKTPGFYDATFPNAAETGIDPVDIGIGLGLAQGSVLGLVTGCVAVLATTWYAVRTHNRSQ